MRYDKQFWYDLLPTIFEIISMIILALIFKNVWALVFGGIIGRLVTLVCSYIFHPFRPKILFSWKLLAPFFHYGKWVGLAGIISFIASRFDQMVLGATLNTTDLGHYVVALALGTLPATELSKAFITILFPLYSRYANNKETLINIYSKVTKVIASVAIPASMGLFILAANAVLVIYGTKWLPIVLIVKMFCLLGIVKSVDYLINPLTLGSGKSKITVINSSIIAIFSLIFSVWAVKNFGLLGAVSVVLVGQLVAVLVNGYILTKKMSWKIFDIYRPLFVPGLAGLLMALCLNWFKDLFVNDIFGLLIKVFFGVICYILFLLVIDKVFGKSSLGQSWQWIKTNVLSSIN